MRIKLAFCITSFLFLTACISNNNKNHFQKYLVQPIENNRFYWDSIAIIDKIIPLETKNYSLLDRFSKGIVEKNSMFLMDRSDNLFKFDCEGHFLSRIGQKGRGPGEYRELNDFMTLDQAVYILDYRKIHLFQSSDGKYIKTFGLELEAFNTSKFLIFDTTRFYLWDSNPYQVNPNGSGHKLQLVVNGKIASEYFKYYHDGIDGPRFCKSPLNYILYPAEDENRIYRITRDSIFLSFELDFGDKFLPNDFFQNSPEWKDYHSSNYFKGINNLYETAEYIYFACTGPERIAYEGLINKKTKRTILGTRNISSPTIFYADEKYMYGYYEPYYLKQFNKELINSSFVNNMQALIESISAEDNIIIVKIKFK
jgi:hypothetical protein